MTQHYAITCFDKFKILYKKFICKIAASYNIHFALIIPPQSRPNYHYKYKIEFGLITNIMSLISKIEHQITKIASQTVAKIYQINNITHQITKIICKLSKILFK